MPGSRFQAVREHLHLSIDPNRSGNGRLDQLPPSPGSSSSPTSSTRASISTSRASIATTRTSYSTHSTTDVREWVLFSVLCLHDFETDDPDHLPFRKNEILGIVKMESTGWWAAMKPQSSNGRVGWIPSAFVAELDDAELDKLQSVRFDLRVFEYDAERLYNSAPISHLHHLDPEAAQSPYMGTRGDGWVHAPEEVKVPSQQLVTPSGLIPGSDPQEVDAKSSYFAGTETASPGSGRFKVPPSPSTPIPKPPVTVTVPLQLNKPTPPIPTRSNSTSALINHTPNPVARTRSDTASAALSGRSLRRRPVLVDDRGSLARLSTLVETNNPIEVDILTSPQMSGSFDSLLSVGKSSIGDVKPFARDEAALNFHSSRLGQSHLPWYLRPTYDSDMLKVDSEGRIKGGTLSALVERLTVDSLPDKSQEIAFRDAFLMTFRTFASPEQVLELLIERYQMDHPAGLNSLEFEEWKDKKLRPTQKRVLTILTMWLEDHHMLDEEPRMAKSMSDFLSLIVTPQQHAVTAKLILQSLERLTFARPQPSPCENGTKKRKKSKAYKNDILKLDPSDIAEQLCLHEHYLYAKIRPQECLNWAKTQSGRSVANVIIYCGTHDKLGAWVKMSILNQEVLGKRADTVDFWIKVAEKCRLLNNFASMSAIVTALSSTVVSRLHLTWAHAGRKSQLEALLKYNAPSGGFGGYRALLQSVEGPCVPFIMMFLTDIVHIQDQIPDHMDSDTPQEPIIWFTKRQKWHDAITAALKYQSTRYPFSENEPSKNFIMGQLRTGGLKDQSWFWQRSGEVQQTELAHADIRKGLEAAGF